MARITHAERIEQWMAENATLKNPKRASDIVHHLGIHKTTVYDILNANTFKYKRIDTFPAKYYYNGPAAKFPGTIVAPGPVAGGAVNTGPKYLPNEKYLDAISLQKVDRNLPKLKVLGGADWTNWKSIPAQDLTEALHFLEFCSVAIEEMLRRKVADQ